MNACPGPDSGAAEERTPVRERPARHLDAAVPRQPYRGGSGTARLPEDIRTTGAAPPYATAVRGAGDRPVPPDPLEHPDPVLAADAAAGENLLRCWVRENGLLRPDGPHGET
ncbi:MAG TPA: iron transporter, partial [Streptomyces sp.]|nr:iron transporter [Streptomyces sp.]